MIDYRKDDSETKPNQIDVYVGKRMRMRRTLLGLSQAEVGESLNLTFQQIQKYEQGANRIGSSRLYDLSQILNIPITYFFEGMEAATYTNTLPDSSPVLRKDPAAKRETIELVRAFSKIEDSAVRNSILEMINSVNQKY